MGAFCFVYPTVGWCIFNARTAGGSVGEFPEQWILENWSLWELFQVDRRNGKMSQLFVSVSPLFITVA